MSFNLPLHQAMLMRLWVSMDILPIFDASSTYDTSYNHLQSHAYMENNSLNILKIQG